MAFLKSSKHKKLLPEELKYIFNQENIDGSIDGDSTQIVGQERALKALRLGVELRKQGYNIFITGLSGTGKTTTVKKMLKTLQPNCTALNDFAYVNNFEDEDKPLLLKFKVGHAVKFKREMLRAIHSIQKQIINTLESELYAQSKQKLIEDFELSKEKIIKPFNKKIKKDSLTVGHVKEGDNIRMDMLAIINNKLYPSASFPELIKNKIITEKKANTIFVKYQNNIDEFKKIYKEIYKLSNQFNEALETQEQNLVQQIVVSVLDEVKSKFHVAGLSRYLKMVESDIVTNLAYFKKGTLGANTEESEYDYLRNYEVNVILNNSKQKGCPVIVETSPTYKNIFGTIEKYNDGEGGWFSDFTSIKAGALLCANGGYLILNAADAFAEPGVWKSLKRVLYYGSMEIEDKHSSYQASPSIMKPEAIQISTKIILIGSAYTYSMLSAYEDDFNKIFKVKAEFDSEMKRNDSNVSKYVAVIKNLIKSEKLKEFDATAISKVLEYSARYADSKNKLTTRFSYIVDILREADFWATDVSAKVVSGYHVLQAYNSARERHGLYETKVDEMFEDGTMMIDTSGSRVGQINGLAVYGGDRFSFGKPTRITATVALGNGQIINVEREAGLSGSTHNKGVLVITGYLKEMFGKNIPLSFNASLVFEQGYGMIDGDSASITEIVALISAMTEIPIKQSFAITGSVNQKGDIQPIGGVNDKVEGFFDLCKARGLTGKEGVIIPSTNIQDLMLKDEVVEAVGEKQFSIYAVSKVEEALELLLGVKAGKKLVSGHYQANTIFGEVEKRLREMQKKVISAKQQPKQEQSKKKIIKKKK